MIELDLGLLSLDRIIIHEIPRRNEAAVPELSDVESPATPEGKLFFLDQLKKTMARSASPVSSIDPVTSVVPPTIASMLRAPNSDAREFVSSTQLLANSLFHEQTGANSSGLLVAASGMVGSVPTVCLMKLERRRGARAPWSGPVGGRTVEIQMLNDLLLSEDTRVYKAAVLVLDPDLATLTNGVTALAGEVSDLQNNYEAAGIAQFFLRFLGCEYSSTPRTQTKSFFDTAQKFINQADHDGEVRAKYETALLAEVGSEKTQIDPTEFATDHLQPEHRDAFFSALEEASLGRESFPKNTDAVANDIKRVTVSFDSGIVVKMHPDDLDGSDVTLTGLDNGKSELKIIGFVNSLRGKR